MKLLEIKLKQSSLIQYPCGTVIISHITPRGVLMRLLPPLGDYQPFGCILISISLHVLFTMTIST